MRSGSIRSPKRSIAPSVEDIEILEKAIGILEKLEETNYHIEDRSDLYSKDEDLDDKEAFKCENCHKNDVIDIEGFVTCVNCGKVITRKLELSAEYHFYGNEDGKTGDPSRCGLPTNHLLPASSLGTVIIGSSKSYMMRKVKQHHTYNTMPSYERDLYKVYAEITQKGITHSIPSAIIDEAKELYKKMSDTQVFRGANRKGLIASCIYYACKNKGVPRSAKEIAEIFAIDVGVMTKGSKKMAEMLGQHQAEIHLELDTSRSCNFIGRYCSVLEITDPLIIEIAKFIADRVDRYGISSENTPQSMAASIVYLTIQLFSIDIKLKAVSDSCGTSGITIMKCYRTLVENIKLILPKKIIEHPDIVKVIAELEEKLAEK